MNCATVGDLKRLLADCNDDDVLFFRVFDESGPETLRYSSDIADKETLYVDSKSAYQTSDGDRDVARISLHLDLTPCE